MLSIKDIYKIGRGPSSSHSMGPSKAANLFAAETPNADSYQAILYGSLAKTGHGHGTDSVIRAAFAPKTCEIIFSDSDEPLPHENTMDLIAFKNGETISKIRVLSIGGGDIEIVGRPSQPRDDIYPLTKFSEISAYCKSHNMRLSTYVESVENSSLKKYVFEVWNTMKRSIMEGLSMTGTLPGGLGVERKAQYLFNQVHIDESEATRENRIVCAYAFAASEQNADNGIIVTAPTCGACSVVPSVLLYMQEKKQFSDQDIIRALEVAGLIGNIVKENASISGAECGCQAEIGTACSMASAALCELFGMGIDQIEYAAEVAMEHYLGLTCDPICGLVQIPCIERNAVAAMRAINALSLANFLAGTRKIAFDEVVHTMYETGKDMPRKYRETAEGGLAKIYRS